MKLFVLSGFILLVLVTVAGCGISADSLRNHPGYAEMSYPDNEPSEHIQLSLGPMVMKIAAKATAEDPEIGPLMQNVRGVVLRVYESDSNNNSAFKDSVNRNAKLMIDHGWNEIVRVNDNEERVSVLMKLNDDVVDGVVVMVVDSMEAVYINLIGDIAPEDIGPIVSEIRGNVQPHSVSL